MKPYRNLLKITMLIYGLVGFLLVGCGGSGGGSDTGGETGDGGGDTVVGDDLHDARLIGVWEALIETDPCTVTRILENKADGTWVMADYKDCKGASTETSYMEGTWQAKDFLMKTKVTGSWLDATNRYYIVTENGLFASSDYIYAAQSVHSSVIGIWGASLIGLCKEIIILSPDGTFTDQVSDCSEKTLNGSISGTYTYSDAQIIFSFATSSENQEVQPYAAYYRIVDSDYMILVRNGVERDMVYAKIE